MYNSIAKGKQKENGITNNLINFQNKQYYTGNAHSVADKIFIKVRRKKYSLSM